MAFIDYYKILGVDKTIPQKDVKKAYLKRAKQFHPDLHPDDPKAQAKFQALQEAYDVIGDPESDVSTTNMASNGSRPTSLVASAAVVVIRSVASTSRAFPAAVASAVSLRICLAVAVSRVGALVVSKVSQAVVRASGNRLVLIRAR